MEQDLVSIKRMIEHHVKLGVKGLFLCGTAGEGHMLTTTMRERLLSEVAEQTDGRLILTTQVTDNSTPRVLEKIEEAAKYGMDVAIVSTPNFMANNTPENLLALFTEIVRNSPLPVGIYDRGSFGSVAITTEVVSEIAKENNVVMLKDSSASDDHMSALLKAREANPKITLLNGNEFNCVHYIKNGYDGLLLGGGVFNARMAKKIMDLTLDGKIDEADTLQERMSEMMHNIFGGDDNKCWLTGQKQLLVELGVFSTNKNFYNYPLTASCVAKIKEELEREKAYLL
jgi:4-hydroxy-tetrahydrodipicolinate synthase